MTSYLTQIILYEYAEAVASLHTLSRVLRLPVDEGERKKRRAAFGCYPSSHQSLAIAPRRSLTWRL
jgi:hypothetical protein